MTPSHPHENIVDGSTGCQTQPIDGPRSCARYCCNFLVRLKSQKKSLPLLSPLQTNRPSGLTAISHAYPATLCPSNFFFFWGEYRSPGRCARHTIYEHEREVIATNVSIRGLQRQSHKGKLSSNEVFEGRVFVLSTQ